MMRRSVICHTNDIDTNNNNVDKYDNNVQQQQITSATTTCNYSIQNLLAIESKAYNQGMKRDHHQIRHYESKDSGFEDDDEFIRVTEDEEMNDNGCNDDVDKVSKTPFSALQNDGDYLSMNAPMPKLIHHKGKFQIESYTTYTSTQADEFYRKVISHGSFPDDYLKNLQLMDPNSSQFKRRFESSVLSALRDPQIQYLLTLYSFVDERLLRNTLLKFLRGSSLDTDTLHAAENYLKKNKTVKDDVALGRANNHLNENAISKSDALFDFILQSRQQTKFFPSDSSIDMKITERHQTEQNLYHSQTGRSELQSPNYENKSVKTLESRCEYCQKTFSTEQSLTRHLRTHEGKRSHKCSQCSRSFYDQASYMRHVRSHSGDKKHKCEQCSMAFNKRSALEVHIRTHTGERPFVCKYCGKGFSISGNLHRHVLIHTGHRPYKCGKCPRAFNNPSHLARHINSFHT